MARLFSFTGSLMRDRTIIHLSDPSFPGGEKTFGVGATVSTEGLAPATVAKLETMVSHSFALEIPPTPARKEKAKATPPPPPPPDPETNKEG